LEALYSRAMALVFPSRYEGFGWPVIEAQASGCPVICSHAGPLPEVVGEGGIICPLDDEEAFASAILRLSDPVERDSWVRRGLVNAAEFSTERMIEGYLAIYDEVEGRP
jgi:glycosyltransferase involved in cell wall biosynthesis